jgi:hypothetical protein
MHARCSTTSSSTLLRSVPVIDAKAFAPQVDGFLFVAEWGATPTNVVRDILNAEPQIKSKILGVILNKTDMTELGKFTNFGGAERYRQKYVSYYTDETPKAGAGGRRRLIRSRKGAPAPATAERRSACRSGRRRCRVEPVGC